MDALLRLAYILVLIVELFSSCVQTLQTLDQIVPEGRRAFRKIYFTKGSLRQYCCWSHPQYSSCSHALLRLTMRCRRSELNFKIYCIVRNVQCHVGQRIYAPLLTVFPLYILQHIVLFFLFLDTPKLTPPNTNFYRV